MLSLISIRLYLSTPRLFPQSWSCWITVVYWMVCHQEYIHLLIRNSRFYIEWIQKDKNEKIYTLHCNKLKLFFSPSEPELVSSACCSKQQKNLQFHHLHIFNPDSWSATLASKMAAHLASIGHNGFSPSLDFSFQLVWIHVLQWRSWFHRDLHEWEAMIKTPPFCINITVTHNGFIVAKSKRVFNRHGCGLFWRAFYNGRSQA